MKAFEESEFEDRGKRDPRDRTRAIPLEVCACGIRESFPINLSQFLLLAVALNGLHGVTGLSGDIRRRQGVAAVPTELCQGADLQADPENLH